MKSLDQTLKDRGRIGRLIGGLVKWHHEHGIKAGSCFEYGTGGQKTNNGVGSGHGNRWAVNPRPSIMRDLKGKRVDDGWGWGMQRTLREGDVTPLIELGALTLDLLTTAQGTALMGIEVFKRAFPKAKSVHVKAMLAAREALCETPTDDNKPAELAEAAKHTGPQSNPLKRAWKAWDGQNPTAAAGQGVELTLQTCKKNKKRKSRQSPQYRPPRTKKCRR